MPLTIESPKIGPTVSDLRERRVRRGTIRDRGRRIRIGLVNNMPDAALQATERQFARLLEDSSGDYDIRLVLVTLDALPREPSVREAIAGAYRAPDALRALHPDAILVTGAEPRAPELSDEPFWSELTALIDWARGAHVLDPLFLPRRAYGRAASGRRRATAAVGQIVRRVRFASDRVA